MRVIAGTRAPGRVDADGGKRVGQGRKPQAIMTVTVAQRWGATCRPFLIDGGGANDLVENSGADSYRSTRVRGLRCSGKQANGTREATPRMPVAACGCDPADDVPGSHYCHRRMVTIVDT